MKRVAGVVVAVMVAVGVSACGDVDQVIMTDSDGCQYSVRLVRDLNRDGKRIIVDGETLYGGDGKPMCGAK